MDDLHGLPPQISTSRSPGISVCRDASFDMQVFEIRELDASKLRILQPTRHTSQPATRLARPRHASLQLLAQRQAARPLHAPPEAAQATPVPLPADHAAPQPPYLSLAPGLPLTSRLLESRISFQQTKRPSQRLGRFRPYMQTRSGRQHQATASSGCSNGWW